MRHKLRKQLSHCYVSVAALDAFVLDYFPEVYRQFGPGWSRTAKETLLLELIEPERLSEALQHQPLPRESWPVPDGPRAQVTVQELVNTELPYDISQKLLQKAAIIEFASTPSGKTVSMPIAYLSHDEFIDWQVTPLAGPHVLRITGRRQIRVIAEEAILHLKGRREYIDIQPSGSESVVYKCRATRRQVTVRVLSGNAIGVDIVFDVMPGTVLSVNRQTIPNLCLLAMRDGDSERFLVICFSPNK